MKLQLALCLFLFDDKALRRVMPRALVPLLLGRQVEPATAIKPPYKYATVLLASLVMLISASQIWEMASGKRWQREYLGPFPPLPYVVSTPLPGRF